MKMRGYLCEEDFNQGDIIFVDKGYDFEEVSVINVKPDEIFIWPDGKEPYWEKAAKCFKKEVEKELDYF
jgi:hypothetical protein